MIMAQQQTLEDFLAEMLFEMIVKQVKEIKK